jgi:hypothetical protein
VVEHGVTGLLAKDVEEMAGLAVELLTGDGRWLASIARAAQESWSRRFTLERYQREILQAIEESVVGRSGIRHI